MYRQYFRPRHAQRCAYVHRYSRRKTFLHSCGSIHALFPDLIAAGFDVINPVQTNCRDMEPERLKHPKLIAIRSGSTFNPLVSWSSGLLLPLPFCPP